MSNTEHVLGGWSADCLAFTPHILQFLVIMALTISYSGLMENPSAFPSGRSEIHPWLMLWSKDPGIISKYSSHLSFVSCIQLLGHCLTCEWKMFSYLLIWNKTTKGLDTTLSPTCTTGQGLLSPWCTQHKQNYSFQIWKVTMHPWPDSVILFFLPEI